MHTESTDKKNNTIRLDKLLSDLGLCSRRGAEKFVLQNNVTVNGKRVKVPGTRILSNEKLLLNGKVIKKLKLEYFILNKPKGVVSTVSDELGRINVTQLIHTKERIFPVGRLDRDTTGLILLTNDGELTNLLTHPRYHIPKTYLLTVRLPVSQEQVDTFKTGVVLEEGMTKPAKIKIIKRIRDKAQIEVTIFEGKKRQIRRMCDKVGLKLTALQRIQIGPIELGDLKVGEYTSLSKTQIIQLKKLATRKPTFTKHPENLY